jgi:cell division protease FtsH
MKLLLLNFIALGLNVMSFSYNQRYNPFKKANMKPPVESYRQEEKGHLDSKNIKNLEKLFYLRNNKYSPFKNVIYMKHKNNNINVTSLFEELNDQFKENVENDKNLTRMFEEAFNNTNNILENNLFNNNTDDANQDAIERMRNYNRYRSPVRRIIIRSGNGENSDDFDDEDENDIFEKFRQTASYQQKKSSQDNSDHSFELVKNSKFNFTHIGGYDKIKEELEQVLDIIRNKKRYEKFNVRIPRGLIFEGPPGNGKTLLAKGFCGEANMSFIPVSGSEFSEKYVGVGAQRVRDLFKMATNNAPCIIFIDEMDALARKRGNDMVNSNSEKDQTLNQLLIAMDGFSNEEDVFVIGSTNRLDLLDSALLRPGRMDKKVYIGSPDSATRKEILNIHLKGKPLDKLVHVDSIVEMTGGYSGAQIENLLNEAMLYVLRNDRELIEWSDLEYINNRVLAGWQDKESKFSEEMIDRIIVHELGHAIVGFLSTDHSNVMKVVLNMWSPTSPGYTVFENNDEDSNIYTKDGLLSHLMVLLGGRLAEEIFYGYSVTSGAKQDLAQAYELAKTMIINYGMGEKNIYPDLSDQSKYLIDQEISKLLMEANELSYKIIDENKAVIKELIDKLKDTKLVVPKDIYEAMDVNVNKSEYLYINNQYYRLFKEKLNIVDIK